MSPRPAEPWQWPCFQFKSPPKPTAVLGGTCLLTDWATEKQVGLKYYRMVLDFHMLITSRERFQCLAFMKDLMWIKKIKVIFFFLISFCKWTTIYSFSWTFISPGWYNFLPGGRSVCCMLCVLHYLPPGNLSPQRCLPLTLSLSLLRFPFQ